MTKEQAVVYLRFSGFSDEQIKAIEGAFSCEDCISALNRVMEYTYGMLTAEKAGLQHLIKSMLDDLPSVNPQKPICPSAGVDCEDCPAYEDAISRKAVFEQIGGWIASGEYEFTNATDYLSKRIKAIPPVSSSEKSKSEWEHDHEILKAYSDGASAVLESIKYLIEQYEHILMLLEDDMKDGSATIVTKTKYAVYTEVVKQLKELLESEVQS